MKEFISNLRFSWKYAKSQKARLLCFCLCNIINIIISIFVPILSAKIVINLTSNEFKQTILVALIIFIVESLRNIINYFTRYFSQVVYRETFTKIESDLGREILRLENRCLDSNSSGVFIRRLTQDTSGIADIFSVLNEYLTRIITNIGIFFAIIINKLVFIFLVFMVLIIYIIEKKRVVLYNEKDKNYRKSHEKVAGFVSELVRGAKDIKMLDAEDSFMERLNIEITNLNKEKYLMAKQDRNYSFIRGTFIDLFDIFTIFLLVYLNLLVH